MHTLTHAYCVNESGEFIDVRGTFSDKEEFLSIFPVANDKEKREKFLHEFFKNGVTEYDEEADEFYTVPFIF